jgi:hypothetical protein
LRPFASLFRGALGVDCAIGVALAAAGADVAFKAPLSDEDAKLARPGMFLFITPRLFRAPLLALFARLTITGRILLLTAMINLLVGSVSANAEVSELINSKCEIGCRSALDQCAAVSNKVMETALKETTAYSIGSPEREKADVKFESAFVTAENCWDKYHSCTGKCRPPKKCLDACQSTFKQCFAAGEQKMKEGLREMRKAKFGSPEWQTAYGKGDKETDHCLQDNRSCQAKCANP